MNAAHPPFRTISRSKDRPSRRRRPVMTTLAPSRASSRAVAAPMPLVPPVISATSPWNSACFGGCHERCSRNCCVGRLRNHRAAIVFEMWAAS